MLDLIITNAGAVVNAFRKLISAQPTEDFNKRETGLKLSTFLTVFAVKLAQMGLVTQEELANKCQELQPGLTLTKQALSKRLPAGAKALKNSWRRSSRRR